MFNYKVGDTIMTQDELTKISRYLQIKFGNPNISIRPSVSDSSMAEVYIGSEFIATIYKDEEDGEISYDLNMSIIDIDLKGI